MGACHKLALNPLKLVTAERGVLLFHTSEHSSASQDDGLGILLKGLMDYILCIKILMAMTTYRFSLESVLNWIWNFKGPV